MTRLTSWRVGAVAVAVGLLAAACSGGGGGSGSDSTGAVGIASNGAPTGIAGGSTGASGSKSASKGAKSSASTKPARGSSTKPAGSASSSSHHSGGGGGGGGGSHSTSSAPSNGCVDSAPPKATDPSKASITICPAHGLSAANTASCPEHVAAPCVRIVGHSFKPNESLVVAECRYLGENAGGYQLSDCNIRNLLTFAPAKTTRSDGSGNVGPITVHVDEDFKQVHCKTQDQCLISVAVPVQKSSLDNPHVLISFS